MKKIFFILFISILIFSCKKEEEQPVPEAEVKLKEITAKIELPTGSSINANDLKVSTILTENAPVVNANAKVQTFDADAIELAFATNAQGKMVLLSYFDPIDGGAIQLNLDNTAIALVMMHPWTVDLSVSAKKEAAAYIKGLPEYEALKQSIKNSINAGDIDPLATSDVVAKLIVTQKMLFRISEYKEPLQFDIDASKITIENKVSSAAYSIGLYGLNGNLIERKMVDGLGKFQYTINQFTSNTYISSEIPKIAFNTPTADGNYLLKAKSGLSFDNSTENLEAAYENSKILLSNTIGIFSTKLKAIVRLKAGKCGGEIGAFVYNGTTGTTSIANSLKAYSENNKSKYLLVKDVLFFVKEKYDGMVQLINSCSSNPYNIQKSPFKTFFNYLDILSRLENAFNGGAHLADWLQFNKTIETCFKRSNNTITQCYPVKLTENNILNTGMYNGNGTCYGGPLNAYFINFNYIDTEKKIKANLSNLRIQYKFENNGCWSAWDTTTVATTYFANYPLTFNNSIINAPIVLSLGGSNSNWVDVNAFFIDAVTGEKISNDAIFKVKRNLNYP